MGSLKRQGGYTFVEVMMVVAIIGILAAIAIPRLTLYRNKAFNAAAESDIHTALVAEQALFGAYKLYGGTVTSSGTAGTSAGTLLTQSGYVATTTAGDEEAVTLSSHVRLQAKTSAAYDAATITAKNDNGDKFFVVETDAGGIYSRSGAAGTAMVAADAVAATNDSAHPDAVTAGYTR